LKNFNRDDGDLSPLAQGRGVALFGRSIGAAEIRALNDDFSPSPSPEIATGRERGGGGGVGGDANPFSVFCRADSRKPKQKSPLIDGDEKISDRAVILGNFLRGREYHAITQKRRSAVRCAHADIYVWHVCVRDIRTTRRHDGPTHTNRARKTGRAVPSVRL
jgi:hypothetical protein